VILGVICALALGIPTQLQITNWLKLSSPATPQEATSVAEH